MTRAWIKIVAAFLLGGVVGAVGARWSGPYLFHRYGESTQAQARMLQRFSATLHLTPEQRMQVAAIFEAKRQKIEALRAEMRPKFEEIRTSTSAEIRRLLTPEQQPRFDVMETEWHRKMKRFHERMKGDAR